MHMCIYCIYNARANEYNEYNSDKIINVSNEFLFFSLHTYTYDTYALSCI